MGAAALSLTGLLKRNLHVMPQHLENRVVTIPIYIDGTVLTVGAAAYKILHLEAGTLVVGGYLVTDVLQNTTLNIGDSAAANTFGSAMTLNSTATSLPWDDLVHKYYDAADEIQITPANALTTAKFWIIVRLIKLNKS